MFDLTPAHAELVRNVTELAEEEFADETLSWRGDPPWENIQRLAEEGYYCLNIDDEYGGGGQTEFEAMLVVEAVGHVDPDTAIFLSPQQMISPRALDMFGTEAAKEKYLPPVIDGEEAMSIAMSEPDAGSDLRAMNTTAESDGDGYVINGEKTWVGFVKWASAAVVWTKVPDGIGSMIVDLDDPGVEIVNHYTNMAGHTQTHFRMNDVIVPAENVLTEGQEGFRQQLEALNWERLSAAVGSNVIAAKAYEFAAEFAGEREASGKPIREHQAVGHKLAEMAKKITASRVLSFQCAAAANRNDRYLNPLGVTMAKLYSSQILEEVVTAALQIHGARGYQQGHPVEYLYRLARGRRIAGGTDEVLKNTMVSMLDDEDLPSTVSVAHQQSRGN